jgi:aminoglycoside phosphotransferase (APT) family kinase protein
VSDVDLALTAPTTRPVAAQHEFDRERLAAFLRDRVASFGGAVAVEQFAGGQSNPTYLVSAGSERYVLRRKPPGTLLPSAHAVDREYRIMRALAASDVPVPKVFALCDDPAVIGTEFFLMEYVPGRVFWDAALPGAAPAERTALYDELNRVIAALHGVDRAAVGLADYGRPGDYLEAADRALDAVPRRRDRADGGDGAADQWLPHHVPAGDETTIVHGDFRIDNVIFHPTEAAHPRRARLGAVDARPSAGRLRVSRDGLARHRRRVPRHQRR